MNKLQKSPQRIFIQTALIAILIIIFHEKLNSQKIISEQEETNLNLSLPVQKCWNFPVYKATIQNIASDNVDKIFLSLSDGIIIGVEAKFGELLWKTDLGGEIISNMLLDLENIYTVSRITSTQNSSQEGKAMLRVLDKSSGIPKQEMNLNLNSQKIYLFEYHEDLVLADQMGMLYRIDKKKGAVVWSATLSSQISSVPFLSDDLIVLGTVRNRIAIYSLINGKEVNNVDTPSIPTTIAGSRKKSQIIWGNKKGFVTSIGKSDINPNIYEKKWRFRNGAEISQIELTSDGFLISSFDNFIYLISEKDGELIWKRRFAGRTSLKNLSGGKYAFVSVAGDSEGFIIEIETGKLINKISLESNNLFTGFPVESNDKLILSTLTGIAAFSPNKCGGVNASLK